MGKYEQLNYWRTRLGRHLMDFELGAKVEIEQVVKDLLQCLEECVIPRLEDAPHED